MTDEDIVIEPVTMKEFMDELRLHKQSGTAEVPLYTLEEVRQIVVDLLDKITWIADAKDVRRAVSGHRYADQEDYFDFGFNEGLDKYRDVIIDTKTIVEGLA